MAELKEFHGPNAGYVLEQYERFRQNPGSLDSDWRAFFEEFSPALSTPPAAGGAEDLSPLLAVRELADAIRARGHTAAWLDPLAKEAPVGDPALGTEAYGLSDGVLEQLPASSVGGPAAKGAGSAAGAVTRLRERYAGTTGYEFDHLNDAGERAWLRQAVETGRFQLRLEGDGARRLLARLSEVEGLERYLHRSFPGQKRFSIEGTDVLVPLLDEVIGQAAADGVSRAVMGMAHRGRLNVLAQLLGKPYEELLAGFLDERPESPEEISGDVKYHLGWEGARPGPDGREVQLCMAPNPSHLEVVNPVVTGMARAAQDDTGSSGPPELHPERALSILIHGDAAFPAQGVVTEGLNLSRLSGYTVGGTIHVIANNQIGFTTDPAEGRSTHYASDPAKGFEVPVVHVNADDPEACLSVARLAAAYRARFRKDFMIDLVGYRRWGHNEGDEPAFTQPEMYEAIGDHPTVRAKWAEECVERGVLSREEADALSEEVAERLSEARAAVEDGSADLVAPEISPNGRPGEPQGEDTGVGAASLRGLGEALLRLPGGFTPNQRLAKLLERRRDALGGEGQIDWGHAEALAFASLLAEGVPIRLTGQDTERGTFSHRHSVLHDAETGEQFVPLHHLPQARASCELLNSPLSEAAAVGFEYGYSVWDPDVLVLWEAQFGDFVNSAQVAVDQFLSAGRAKWGQSSGLVLLLPHGYEGQGPEHSSARLERFLQLAAEDNLRVANCTTAAQYFHLLRRQARLLHSDPRPLIVMSPKSLLRHPAAMATLAELSGGRFRPLIPDPEAAERAAGVTRLLLCSGKVYVDLTADDPPKEAERVALVRIEELYPLPEDDLEKTVNGFPNLGEIVWVQEEPANMGAWRYLEPRLRELAGDLRVRYLGRPQRASPAEGDHKRHQKEQRRLVAEAWSNPPAGRGKRSRAPAARAKTGASGRD